MKKSDLIIIGGGPGGYHAADYAAKQGLQVIVIEKGNVGGTCLNEGCIPTKSFVHDAELLRNPLLSCVGGGIVDFKNIRERKDNVVSQLREGVETILSQKGIILVRGCASFKDSHTVEVDGETYQADNIIIATGSHAKIPPFARQPAFNPEKSRTKVVTSTELLDIKEVPDRLAIVGAGVVGMEFASVFNSFGSDVRVYEFMKECLPAVDKDIAKRLRKNMEKQGIQFNMKYSVKSIEELDADVVLIAVGRAANTEGLNLEAAGVKVGKNGITVDDNMRTNVPGIYAIGDVNGRQMLAHAAIFQGLRAVNQVIGKTDDIRFDVMPAAVFTYPEAACVGPSEDTLKEQGIVFKTHKGFYRSNGKALATDETEGMLKLFVGEDRRVLGCHVFGAHAADIVQEVSGLMTLGVTVDRLHDIIHIHPTYGEILQDAIQF